MRITELISLLQDIEKEHSDDDVWFYRDGEFVGLMPDDISFESDSYEQEAAGLYIGL